MWMVNKYLAASASSDTVIYCDCQGVVDGMQNMDRFQPEIVAAGHLRLIQHRCCELGRKIPVVKVKAHQDWQSLEGEARLRARGNDLADQAAKAGACLHPPPAPMNMAELTSFTAAFQGLIRLVATMLPLWPVAHTRYGRRLDRKVMLHNGKDGQINDSCTEGVRGHVWAPRTSGFSCLLCAKHVQRRPGPKLAARHPCTGVNEVLKKVLKRNLTNGHNLIALSWRGHLSLACSACGRWCYKGKSDLLEQITCPTLVGRSIGKKGLMNLKRIGEGRHPDPRMGDDDRLELCAPWSDLEDQTADTTIALQESSQARE